MAEANQGEALNWAHPDKSFFQTRFGYVMALRGLIAAILRQI